MIMYFNGQIIQCLIIIGSKVNLEGTLSNRQGIECCIEISLNDQKQYRSALCGEGYLSQNSASQWFGLGCHIFVDYVKTLWLSGEDIIYGVNVNTFITLVEGTVFSVDIGVLDNVVTHPDPVKDIVYVS